MFPSVLVAIDADDFAAVASRSPDHQSKFDLQLKAWFDSNEVQTVCLVHSSTSGNLLRTNWQLFTASGELRRHEDSRDGSAIEPEVDADTELFKMLGRLSEHLGIAADRVYYFGSNAVDALQYGFNTVVLNHPDGSEATYLKFRDANAQQRLFVPNARTSELAALEGACWYELPACDYELDSAADRLGAIPTSSRRTHFRVWSPRRKRVEVEIDGGHRFPLQRHANGYHTGTVEVGPDQPYLLALDDEVTRPDPTSRFQPRGVHHESQVCTGRRYPWGDSTWSGVAKEDLVIYELHLGSFTPGGTYLSAIERLPELVELGVTAIELLPVAQSPGSWNWGYDGVNLYAPRNSFGRPDDFRYFVDRCHQLGLAVFLDVVYNHLGPEGNYLRDFAPYFTRKYHTPWGEAFDFDGRQKEHVRRYIVENAVYWLEEFHLDGLRLDAVHFMFDDQDYTILDAIRDGVQELRERVDRCLHLIAEANVYDHDLVVGADNKPPYDGAWSDDMMHSIYAIGVDGLSLTPRQYEPGHDLKTALHHGFVYYYPPIEKADDAQRSKWFEPGDRSYVGSLITALQTHDSVGNHPHGHRLHQLTSVEFQKAAVALMILYPSIPMIFMGEEFASQSPFPFFVDFEDERLRKAVDRGRANEYPQHAWDGALSPSNPQAFYATKCPLETTADETMRPWYRDLLAFRRHQRAQGVLDWRNLRIECDHDASLYGIRYQSEQGGFAVFARLQPHDRDLSETHELPETKLPLFCSLGLNERHASGRIRLQTNHAIVVPI